MDKATRPTLRWPGLIAPLGGAALLSAAALVGYECGRYHRSPAELLEAARQRVQHRVEAPHFIITNHMGETEPNHQGKP